MIQVEVKNGDVAGALREFKKKVKKSGILDDLKNREYFVSKSEKRRLKKAAAKRRK